MKVPFYKRKKVIATATGIAVVIATKYFGFPAEEVERVLNFLMVYVVGQGIADVGKEVN